MIFANRLFRSSKGAPVLLIVLLAFGGLRIGVRPEEYVDLREPEVAVVTTDSLDERGTNSEMVLRALRKTV